jgi:N-acyl homoserine lactone hydrolase
MNSPMTEIRLYLFQCGVLKCRLHNIEMNQGLNEPYEIPVPWFFIEHPKGNVVIDGGNAVECATDPRGHWGGHLRRVLAGHDSRTRLPPRASENWGRSKIGPLCASIPPAFGPHRCHRPFLGSNPRRATGRIRIRFTPDWFAAGGYLRKDFDKPGLNWFFLDGPHADFYDLYGDGAIVMIFTPGHAPGHQSFLINLPGSEPLLLTVDAAYTLDHWNEKALPGFLASTVDTVRSVRKLKEVARKTGAVGVTGHDPDAWPSFKQAPAHYG